MENTTVRLCTSQDTCKSTHLSRDATKGGTHKKHRHKAVGLRKSGNVAIGNPSQRQPEVQGHERRWLSQRRTKSLAQEFGEQCKNEEQQWTYHHRIGRTLLRGPQDVEEQPWIHRHGDRKGGEDGRYSRQLNDENPGPREVPGEEGRWLSRRMTQEAIKEVQETGYVDEERSLCHRPSSRAQHGDRVLRNRRYRRPFDDHRHTKRLFTPEIKKFLKDWLVRRRDHPYPNRDEKKRLAVETGLTYIQICNWFANWRRKLKNTGDEHRTTWGHLIKSYNTQAQGNVEQFSICSDDSIWEQKALSEPGDGDDEDEGVPTLTYTANATAMDHSYSVIQPKNAESAVEGVVQDPSENQPQCFQVTSTTTEEEDAHTTQHTVAYTSGSSKYKGCIADDFHTIPQAVASTSVNSKSKGNSAENYRYEFITQGAASTSGNRMYKDHIADDFNTISHTVASTSGKSKEHNIINNYTTTPHAVASTSGSDKYIDNVAENYHTKSQVVASTSGSAKCKSNIDTTPPQLVTYAHNVEENTPSTSHTAVLCGSSGSSKYKSAIMQKYLRDLRLGPTQSNDANSPCCSDEHKLSRPKDNARSEPAPNSSSAAVYEKPASCGDRNTRYEKKKKNVKKTKGTCPPMVLSKWLESAAKFQPTKSYVPWNQSKKDTWRPSRSRNNNKKIQRLNETVEGEERSKMKDVCFASQGHLREELEAAEALTRLSGMQR